MKQAVREFPYDSVLVNFFYKDKSKISKKLSSFISGGKSKLHLVLDFDRTMTTSRNELSENVSTWELLRKHLSVESQKEYQRFYNLYRQKEVKNRLTRADAVTWWESILTLFKKENLKWSIIKSTIRKEMPARQHVRELFDACRKKNIPTIVISAGIKDVINIWCEKHEIKPTKTLSTKLLFSTDGQIKGWDKKSLIHVLNKKERGHSEVTKIRLSRPHTILVGDSIDDTHIVAGEENVLRIMVHDPRKDDSKKSINKFLQYFDLIITNGNLLPVAKLVDLFS